MNKIIDRICLKVPSMNRRDLQILPLHCCCACLWVSRRVHGQLAWVSIIPEEFLLAGSFTPCLLFFGFVCLGNLQFKVIPIRYGIIFKVILWSAAKIFGKGLSRVVFLFSWDCDVLHDFAGISQDRIHWAH